MYNLSYSSPCELQGILEFKNGKNPYMSGLGYYEDVDGDMWDVVGVIGCGNPPYIQARPLSDSPDYYGTASWQTQNGHHSWMPYLLELGEGHE